MRGSGVPRRVGDAPATQRVLSGEHAGACTGAPLSLQEARRESVTEALAAPHPPPEFAHEDGRRVTAVANAVAASRRDASYYRWRC